MLASGGSPLRLRQMAKVRLKPKMEGTLLYKLLFFGGRSLIKNKTQTAMINMVYETSSLQKMRWFTMFITAERNLYNIH